MKSKTLDAILKNLFFIIPMLNKSMLKLKLPDSTSGIHLSRLHFEIIAILSIENSLPISEIGKLLFISKPQMTFLINQLVKAEIVDKESNPRDKRITEVKLTDKGKIFFKRCDDIVRTNLRQRLSFLDERELEALALALEKIREICSRLEKKRLGKK